MALINRLSTNSIYHTFCIQSTLVHMSRILTNSKMFAIINDESCHIQKNSESNAYSGALLKPGTRWESSVQGELSSLEFHFIVSSVIGSQANYLTAWLVQLIAWTIATFRCQISLITRTKYRQYFMTETGRAWPLISD